MRSSSIPLRFGRRKKSAEFSEVFWRLHGSHGSRGSHLSFFVQVPGPLSLSISSFTERYISKNTSFSMLYQLYGFMCFLDLNMTVVSNPPSYRIVSIGGCIFSAVHMIRTIKHSMKESIYVIEYLFLPMSFMSSCLSLFSSLFIFRLSGKDPQHSKSARLGKAGP